MVKEVGVKGCTSRTVVQSIVCFRLLRLCPWWTHPLIGMCVTNPCGWWPDKWAIGNKKKISHSETGYVIFWAWATWHVLKGGLLEQICTCVDQLINTARTSSHHPSIITIEVAVNNATVVRHQTRRKKITIRLYGKKKKKNLYPMNRIVQTGRKMGCNPTQ